MPTPPEDGLLRDSSDARCWWCGSDPEYVAYHDDEWGRPVTDAHRLYEKLCLEGFQSGLSWLTILRKRTSFREAFAGFDPEKVTKFGESDVTRLLGDKGIVRHRGKIEASIHNAGCMLALRNEFGSLAAYFWRFVPPAAERPKVVDFGAVGRLAKTPTSTRLAKDLKKRGVKFIGPTTAYAFMQAMGIVNDHLEGCHVREEVEAARHNALASLSA
ncbi:MAG: DNA-3-methyladenine glycosylase I [Sandaracinaceae bacterium]